MKKIIIGFILIALIIVLFIFFRLNKSSVPEGTDIIPTPTIILPTIGSDVLVNLKAKPDKRAVVLNIKGIPSDIQSIEYEMTYTTSAGLIRGINGIIKLKGEKEITRDDLTLGSCSSGGKCSYDEGVKSLDLSLKFNSPSNSSVYRNTFTL